MTVSSKYLFTVTMDIDQNKEAIFNNVYDEEHIPNLLSVPGVLSVNRYISRRFTLLIDGQRKDIKPSREPKYMALYELEHPEVLSSSKWEEEVEKGRWAIDIRPYTYNRHHILYEKLT
jgi:hypothetical protein